MDSQQTFSELLERLGYAENPNLIVENALNASVPPELDFSWREIKNKLQIDAVYFVANAPIIYFKRFESFDVTLVADLHRKIWNQSQVPLIFVITPQDIRVYNGYEPPKNTHTTTLIEPQRLDDELSPTKAFWERLERRSRNDGLTDKFGVEI